MARKKTTQKKRKRRKPQSFASSPWLTIWIEPRETIRKIVRSDPKQQLTVLIVFPGIAGTLALASQLRLGKALSLVPILVICVVAAPAVGFITLSVFAALLRWTGSWLGGRASFARVRAAVAWSSVPAFWGLVQWVINLALFGEKMFIDPTLALGVDSSLRWIRLAVTVVGFILGIWGWIILLVCLSEVHRFSLWRALASIALVWPVIVVSICCVGAMLIAGVLISGG